VVNGICNGGAKNTKNLILVAAASWVFFYTFLYSEDKSNECASWQVSQIYFGVVPPTRYIHIHSQRSYVFSSYILLFFPSSWAKITDKRDRNPIHGKSVLREKGEVNILQLFGRMCVLTPPLHVLEPFATNAACAWNENNNNVIIIIHLYKIVISTQVVMFPCCMYGTQIKTVNINVCYV
jgi:hypothetical protein